MNRYITASNDNSFYVTPYNLPTIERCDINDNRALINYNLKNVTYLFFIKDFYSA